MDFRDFVQAGRQGRQGAQGATEIFQGAQGAESTWDALGVHLESRMHLQSSRRVPRTSRRPTARFSRVQKVQIEPERESEHSIFPSSALVSTGKSVRSIVFATTDNLIIRGRL